VAVTLIEFLLARIAEHEAFALAARALQDHALDRWWVDGPAEVSGKWWVYATGEKFHHQAMAEHVARHDPNRVLAECEAKRQIVDLHYPLIECVEWFDAPGIGEAPVCPSCRPKDPSVWNPPMGQAGIRPEGFVPTYTLAPCPTLRALASMYADHPDYQDEWKP
jgi:hypothetical protein